MLDVIIYLLSSVSGWWAQFLILRITKQTRDCATGVHTLNTAYWKRDVLEKIYVEMMIGLSLEVVCVFK